MKTEVNKFIDMTQGIAQKCQVKYIPQNELPKNQRLYGQDTLGYKILGMEEHPQCQWMAMNELKFIDYLRNLQHQKALEILSKYSHQQQSSYDKLLSKGARSFTNRNNS